MKKTKLPIIAYRLFETRVFKKKNPLMISWEITRRCNSTCLYCDSTKNRPGKELETQKVYAIIDQIGKTSVKRISFTGGEPLTRQDIGQIADYAAKKNDLEVSINTNGKLLEDRISDLFNVSYFNISLDGTKDVHDAIRGNGSYEYAIKALDCLKKKGKKFFIVSVLNKYNMRIGQITHLLDIAKHYNTKVSFHPVWNKKLFSDDENILALTKKNRTDLISLLLTLKKTKPDRIDNTFSNLKYFLPDTPNKKLICYAGLLFYRINAKGDIYSCDWGYAMEKEEVLSLHTYSFSEAVKRIRPKECTDCANKGVIDLNLAVNLQFDTVVGLLKNYL